MLSLQKIKFYLLSLGILIITFILSIYVAPFHIYGDQEHYTEAYYSIKGLPIGEAWLVYKNIIYTSEPVHFFIVWLFSSSGIGKNLIMAIFNCLLAFLFIKFLFKKHYNLALIFLIYFSNYYLFTMFFTLERTKFAFIFLLISLLTNKKIFLFLAVFTHSIMLFPIFAFLSSKYLNFISINKYSLNSTVDKNNSNIKIIGFILFCFLIYFYLGEHLISKFNSYAFIDFEIYQIFIIFLLAIISVSNKSEVFIFYFFIMVSIMILGGDRLNMLGYFAFLYYRETNSPRYKYLILILISYFFIKSILYLNMIITTGG